MNKKAEAKVSEGAPDNGVQLFERDRGEIDEREELSGGERALCWQVALTDCTALNSTLFEC